MFGLSNSVAALASEANYAPHLKSSLQASAVQVINSIPLKAHLSGYGVYLGRGFVLTVAHAVGRWTLLGSPQIETAHERVTAKVMKKGFFPNLDLALLHVDEESIPDLQLRLTPLCKSLARIGSPVIVAYPDRMVSSRIVSASLILPAYRANFGTLIREPEGSGSGLYDPERICLLGIMSAAVTTFRPGSAPSRVGYFVPSSKIAAFVSTGSRP